MIAPPPFELVAVDPDAVADPFAEPEGAMAEVAVGEGLVVDAPPEHPESGAIPADVLRAYRETEYRVHDSPPFTLRIGEPCPALLALHARHGVARSAYVTACNPLGALRSPQENEALHASLGDELARLGRVAVEGVGQHPTGAWPGEPSWLVLGAELDAARELGERLRQNAVLWSDADAVPRLVVLR